MPFAGGASAAISSLPRIDAIDDGASRVRLE
jgi:hypothetical protein